MKESRRPAGVLSRDEGNLAENSEGAQRDIFQVADGSGDHIQDAGHARGADSTRMYSAEPLPHFVDEYLAWLHETHPTNATFDGVHLHDDLLEDLSRAAIDAQIRDLGGFARRLAAIDPVAPDRRRSGSSVRRSTPTSARGCSSSRRSAPGSATRSTTATCSRPASPARCCSTTRRCPSARAASLSKLHQVPRLMQAARDNIKDPPGIFIKVGLESLRGALRFIEDDLPRAFGGLHDMRVLGDLADASTEASQAIGALRRLPRERPGAARARLVPSRARRVPAEAAARRRASRSTPIGCWRSPTRELHATQEEFRRVAVAARPEAEGSRSPLGAGQADHPAARPGRRHRAGAARRAEDLHPAPGPRLAARLRRGAGRADAAVLPLDVRQHVDARVRSRRARCAPTTTSPTPIPSWPAERQEEHLRDFNYGALWAISIHEVYPGPLPPLPAPAPGRRRRSGSRSSSRRPRWSKAGRTTRSR